MPWLIWRQRLKNYFRSLDAIENAALEAALAGASFGEVCAVLGQWLPDDEVPLRAATPIGTWTDCGMVTACNDGV